MSSRTATTSEDAMSDVYISRTVDWGVNKCTGERHLGSPPRPNRQQPKSNTVSLKRKDQGKAVTEDSLIVSPRAVLGMCVTRAPSVCYQQRG